MDSEIIKLSQEELFRDENIVVGTIMAPDGEMYIDLKPVFKDLAICPVQTHSLNVGIVDSSDESRCMTDPSSAELSEFSVGSDYRVSTLFQTVADSNRITGMKDGRFEETDALITFNTDTPIGVVTADCVPIMVYAPGIGAVGAIHAGWRGTLGGIVDNVLDIMTDKGADFSKLKVIFGPSISQKKYEVDDAMAERFIEAGFRDSVAIYDKPHIDLQGANAERFIRRGVNPENIHLHKGCSYSSLREDGKYRYQSHRRSHGQAGRMLTYIKLL